MKATLVIYHHFQCNRLSFNLSNAKLALMKGSIYVPYYIDSVLLTLRMRT